MSNKRIIHKCLCIILFTIMGITAILNAYAVSNGKETLHMWCLIIGYLAETPFLILLVVYLYKYRRYKKEEGQDK